VTTRPLGYGVIEGFYGPPWSHEARLAMLRELRELDLDTYLYAPKNDPQHRSSWWRPLDHDARARLRELFDVGRSLGIAVVYGLAPERILGGAWNVRGKARFRRDEDHDGLEDAPFARLRERLEELCDLGADRFALSFDDTWTTFLPGLATFDKGLVHARVARRTLEVVRHHHAHADVYVIPAIYHRRLEDMPSGALAYLRGLASLGSETPVAWTGPNVFSRRIEPGDLARLSRETGLTFFVWSNAVANDWLPLATGEPLGFVPRQKLSFGPPEFVAPGLAERAVGILLNAAREPELTKVSLACLAEQKRDGLAYDPTRAHERALARVFGQRGVSIAERLYDLTKRHPLASPARAEGARLDELVRGFRAGRIGAGELSRELDALAALEGEAREALREAKVLLEIAPTLRKIRLVAEAARLGLDRAEAQRAGRAPLARALGAAVASTKREAAASGWDVGLDAVAELADLGPRDLARSR
jgi:hyaluronoglucosaminidase